MARINNSSNNASSTNSTGNVPQRHYQQQQHSFEEGGYVKRDQIYRMLDKFFYTLSSGVSHDSFASAATLYKELSSHLDNQEYRNLGEAWRNLYVEDNEQGYISLKETVSKIKVRFA